MPTVVRTKGEVLITAVHQSVTVHPVLHLLSCCRGLSGTNMRFRIINYLDECSGTQYLFKVSLLLAYLNPKTRNPTIILLMISILHYLKDPTLQEFRHIPYYG